MERRGGLRARKSDGSTDHLYKPKWRNGKTRTIRVPIAIAEEVLEVARAIDEGKIVEVSSEEEKEPQQGSFDLTQDKEIEKRIKDIMVKVKEKRTGYKANSFTQGIKELKKIEELVGEQND